MTHDMSKLHLAVDQLTSKLCKDDWKQFQASTSDRDRFHFLFNLDHVTDLVQLEAFIPRKCESEAKAARMEGNKLFQKKYFHEALDKYNQSVLLAPRGKCAHAQELALAYANRSAVLFDLGHFLECIHDVTAAMDTGYQKEARYKLHERAAKCHVQLGKSRDALECFRLSLSTLGDSTLGDKWRKKWTNSIKRQIEDVSTNNVQSCETTIVDARKCSIPKISTEASDTFVYASKEFGLAHNSRVGRHVVATEDVSIGDVIGVEKPFASVVFVEHYHTHCQNCFTQLTATFPCRQCSNVAYCSATCEQEAWTKFHHIECGILELLTPEWLGRVGHLALRMVLVAEYSEIAKVCSAPQVDDVFKKGFDPDGRYRSDLWSVYNLETNSPKRSPDNFLQLTLLAVYIAKCLQTSYFFRSTETSPDVNMIGGLLLRNIQIVQSNAYGISQMTSCSGFSNYKPRDFGIGLYGTASLFNHSCDPSLDYNYYGNVCVFRAIRDIRAGEEITADYGPIFFLHPKSERHMTLKNQFYFDCECSACARDWPVWSEIEARQANFLCEKCGEQLPEGEWSLRKPTPCPQCGHNQDMRDVLQRLKASHVTYSAAMDDATAGNIHDALPVLQQHLALMQRLIAPPWQEFVSCQATIKQCYRAMTTLGQTDHL